MNIRRPRPDSALEFYAPILAAAVILGVCVFGFAWLSIWEVQL